MGLTRETGRRNKTKRAQVVSADRKRTASEVTAGIDTLSPNATTHPVHCPTCGRAHTATQHEMLFASHFRPGRPGPEC